MLTWHLLLLQKTLLLAHAQSVLWPSSAPGIQYKIGVKMMFGYE